MVDFPDQTLMTAAPETWGAKQHIYDERFAKALGVDYFALPTKISYSRFPEWYFCPKCWKFQPIDKWISEYQKHTKPKILEKDWHMTRHMQCPECHQDLVVARIVTICEQGHINDFPWVKWVHRQSKKPICNNPSLKFKTGSSGTEGLEGLNIVCSCGAFTTLKGAFDKDCFERLDENAETEIFHCEGNHPHKHIKEKCICYPRTVQKGASSVYFPVLYSSLVIPPYADKLNSQIEKSRAFLNFETTLSNLPDMRDTIIETNFSKWVGEIAQEIGKPSASVETILKRKWLNESNTEIDVASVKYRAEEYEALNGEIATPEHSFGDFSRQIIQRELFKDKVPYVKTISLINKVRVVNALAGFSRISPATDKDGPGFVHIKESQTRWYPTRVVSIFICFIFWHIFSVSIAVCVAVKYSQKHFKSSRNLFSIVILINTNLKIKIA
jgi:hypothetical protein